MSVHQVKTRLAWVVPENTEKPGKEASQQKTFTKKFFQIGLDFCDQTTIHGLGQVSYNKLITSKIMWFMLFLGAQVGLFVHVVDLVQLYLARPVQENTKLTHRAVRFPDVTVCNLNPISPSSFDLLAQDDRSALAQYLTRVENMYHNGTISVQELAKLQTPINLVKNIGEEEMRLVGHQLSDLILRCTFRGQPCNVTSRFTWIMSPVLYNCYTFDPGADGDNFVGTGAENGLSILFYLEETNGSNVEGVYTKDLNAANCAGMKLILHSEKLYPIPEIDGVDIMPGHSTSIPFQAQEIHEMLHPYGECIDNTTLAGFSEFAYSVTPCLFTCLQKHVIKQCGCKSVYQPVPDQYKDGIYCGTLRPGDDAEAMEFYYKEDLCSTDVWLEFSGSQEMRYACGCATPCHRHLYRYTISESRWPAPKYYNTFLQAEILNREDREELKAYQQLQGAMADCLDNSTGYDFISENFARVNVYLQDLEMLELKQQAAYPLSNLFSDIGGTLGLWVGLSVLTIAEFVQLCVRIMLFACGKYQAD